MDEQLRKHLAKIGGKGGKSVHAKYGSAHMSALAKAGNKKRWAKKRKKPSDV